jgi:crotonobetainyl-CoA:carnitine CoA-transferase CaiB-like acyl-CoA transferase
VTAHASNGGRAHGQLPLSGVRVLDLSNLLAGPMATMHLADYGADVIKVEHPRNGDELRRWGHDKDGVGLFFKVLNRNKRTITLDLKSPRGQEIARALARDCDVVAESYRPGTLERWGLGYGDLRRENEDLIMLHVSGFGRTGPWAERRGFGTLAEAYAGAAYITGFPDRPPLLPSFGLGDSSTAIFAAFAVMVALRYRDHHGGGQEIDLGLYEGLFTLLGPQAVEYDQLGLVQERDGSRLPFVAPRNTYQTSDGVWVAIAGSTQATFERICRALEIEELIGDERFATNHLRIKNCPALDDAIQEAVGRLGCSEVMERFDAAGAPVGPVYNIAQIFEDEQFRARDNIALVDDDELGEMRMQNVAVKLSETPGRIAHAGPPKGRYNREVYGELLGLGEAELAELAADGVI